MKSGYFSSICLSFLSVVSLGGSIVRADPPAIRVACVGDSITAGFSASDNESYPAVLGDLLGPAYAVMNFGAGGTQMLKSGDLPYWEPEKYRKFGETSGFDKAIASRPDIVIIMLGTNDSRANLFGAHPDEFEADARSMIETFRNLPTHPRVLLALPPPIFNGGNYDISPKIMADGVKPALKRAAAAEKVDSIDVYDFMLPHPELFWDNVHPTPAGYALLAKCLYFYLTGAPSIEPASPVFLASDRVTLQPNPSADYTVYTTDGNDPTLDSPRYSEPFAVSGTCTIKARSVAHGKLSAFIASAAVMKTALDVAVSVDGVAPGVSEKAYNYDYRYVIDDFAKLKNPAVSINSQLKLSKPPLGNVLVFTGYLKIPTTDLYAFTTTALMGARFYIDDKLVADSWQVRFAATTKTGHIALQAGYHPIRLEYFCGGGVPELEMNWANRTLPAQEIPGSALFHTGAN